MRRRHYRQDTGKRSTACLAVAPRITISMSAVMARDGKYPRGSDHPGAKLTEKAVLWLLKTRESSKRVAKVLGVGDSHVRAIRRGVKWGWLQRG
jgi:hypothetical protein